MLRVLGWTLVVWGVFNLLLWVGVSSQRKPHTLFHGIGALLLAVGYAQGTLNESWIKQIVLATGWGAIILSSALFRRSLTNVKKSSEQT